jgi:hypothetical protein
LRARSLIVGDKAEQAYRRGDSLEKRGQLMVAWASFSEPARADGKIIEFAKAARGKG